MSLPLPSLPAAPATPSAHEYLTSAGQTGPRGFGHSLTFEVGVSYLAGIAAGGGVGLVAGVHKVSTQQAAFTTRLKINQILNSAGKNGSQTANAFAVFALTYSLTRDFVKFNVYKTQVDDPIHDAIGAGVAGTIQGMTRFPKVPALGCGLALGGLTYVSMKYGMDTIKKVAPFHWL